VVFIVWRAEAAALVDLVVLVCCSIFLGRVLRTIQSETLSHGKSFLLEIAAVFVLQRTNAAIKSSGSKGR
jgi:hypothetical protein